jgi:hypothetical protein
MKLIINLKRLAPRAETMIGVLEVSLLRLRKLRLRLRPPRFLAATRCRGAVKSISAPPVVAAFQIDRAGSASISNRSVPRTEKQAAAENPLPAESASETRVDIAAAKSISQSCCR